MSIVCTLRDVTNPDAHYHLLGLQEMFYIGKGRKIKAAGSVGQALDGCEPNCTKQQLQALLREL